MEDKNKGKILNFKDSTSIQIKSPHKLKSHSAKALRQHLRDMVNPQDWPNQSVWTQLQNKTLLLPLSLAKCPETCPALAIVHELNALFTIEN